MLRKFANFLELSALNNSDGTRINGLSTFDYSGASAAAAGDFNGDGLSDVIIGGWGADPWDRTQAGASYVVFGNRTTWPASSGLYTLNGVNGFVIRGVALNGQSGYSVAGIGDFNGDGIDDVIIGAWKADPDALDIENTFFGVWTRPRARSQAGASYVVFGSRKPWENALELSILDGTQGFAINGVSANDWTGTSVSAAGDLNEDGFSDIIIGAPGSSPGGLSQAGASYVIFGGRKSWGSHFELSTLNGDNGFVINGESVADSSGTMVAAAGDFNGDGAGDVIIGAPGASPEGRYQAGTSYVLFGGRTDWSSNFELSALNGSNGFVIHGVSADDLSGTSVAVAGDLNGDGIDDIIIGAPYASLGEKNNTGASYVVFGSRQEWAKRLELSTLNGTNGFAIYGVSPYEKCGTSVAAAGDLNGDGIDDVIIGAPTAASNGAGASYVVFGSRAAWNSSLMLSTLNGTNGFTIYGVSSGDMTGQSVARVGDLNGDGKDDVIIGAPNAAVGIRLMTGISYVVFGGPPLLPASSASPPSSLPRFVPTPTAVASNDKSVSSIPEIIGETVGGLALIGAAALAYYYCFKRNKPADTKGDEAEQIPLTVSPAALIVSPSLKGPVSSRTP